MKEQVRELQLQIATRDSTASMISANLEIFRNENKVYYDAVAMNNLKIDKLKDEIRTLALAQYETNGEKKFYGGIGIQQGKPKEVYAVSDRKAALAFALEKSMFLTIDEVAMLKAADGLDVAFIDKTTVTPPPKVTFPKEIKIDE